jgi:lipoprotein-releasing system permease protein
MGFASFVGLRYLRSKKSNAFLSLITFFSITGVALGVATLIVTLSVMDGFEEALKSRLANGEYHLLVTRAAKAGDADFSFGAELAARYYAASSEIVSVNPVLSTEAIIRAKKRVSGITLNGISESQMNRVAKTLVEVNTTDKDKGEPILPKTINSDGLWIGRELSFVLGVMPGDSVQLISPTETEGPLESVPRIQTLIVEGIFESGIPDKDIHLAYAPMQSVRNFLRKRDAVNSVEIRVKDYNVSVPTGRALREELGEDFLVKDWEQLNAHLFASLKLERWTMFVILTMIITVASFNIVTSLRMNVIEKRKELSILQAMGATPQQIGRIFLFQGSMIGIFGTLIGAIGGLGVCLILKNTNVIKLPDIFYDRTLPVQIEPIYILGIILTALLIVTIAAVSPARAASQVTPLEGIRQV